MLRETVKVVAIDARDDGATAAVADVLQTSRDVDRAEPPGWEKDGRMTDDDRDEDDDDEDVLRC